MSDVTATGPPPVTTFEAPIVAVTVLEDRAVVTRRGTISVGAGVTHLVIPRVSPVMVDKSVSVALSTAAACATRIVDTRPRRRWVVAPETDGESDPKRVALRRELRERINEVSALEALRRRLQNCREAHGNLALETLEDLTTDVSWGAFPQETAAGVADLDDKERALSLEVVALDSKIQRLGDDRDRLQARLAVTSSPDERQRATIEVDVSAERACELVLAVDYMVPCAVWRPYHRAELRRVDGAPLTMSTDACVWQNTGEDWEGVALTLSTERASLGTDPPELETDWLRLTKRQATVDVETRTQTIDVLSGSGSGPAKADGLPGIDDAGEAQHLRVAEPATIPSDGRPHRLNIGAFTVVSTVELVCAAELIQAAVTESWCLNQGGTPLLAGPVDLVMDSGYVGRTSVKFTAAGERFPLGWGPDPDVRVHRHTEAEEQGHKLLSSWSTVEHRVTIRLSNLSGQARVVVLKERVPVSELEGKVKIEVDADDTSEGRVPDSDGIIRWEVPLGPRGHAERTLVYRVRKHDDVRGL